MWNIVETPRFKTDIYFFPQGKRLEIYNIIADLQWPFIEGSEAIFLVANYSVDNHLISWPSVVTSTAAVTSQLHMMNVSLQKERLKRTSNSHTEIHCSNRKEI